jgi:hypothetical protein
MFKCVAALGPICLLLAAVSRGQEPSDEVAAEKARESQRAAIAEVAKFEFALAEGRKARLKLVETPLLKYTNPLRGDVHSVLFLWTLEGRPEVIASVSNWYEPRAYLGLAATSLSLERLVGKREGLEIWRPRAAGLDFRAVPGAEPPAKTAPKRLRQMGELARQFTAEFRREARYNEGGKLPLLTRPLYRYEGVKGNVQDGALFAFAEGTSPQLNLLLESRSAADGYEWQFALAPNNSVEYRVFHNGREVWMLPQLAPPWPNSKNPLNTYTVFPDLQDEGRSSQLADQLTAAAAMER